MDITCKTVLSRTGTGRVSRLSHAAGRTLLHVHGDDGTVTLQLLMHGTDGDGDGGDAKLLHIPLRRPGSHAVLDATGNWVIASHADERTLTLISVSHSHQLSIVKQIKTKFNAPIHSLHSMSSPSVFVAVSTTADILTIPLPSATAKQHDSLHDLSLVHSVSPFSTHYLIILGTSSSSAGHLQFVAIRLSSAAKLTVSSPLTLPVQPSPLLSACFLPHCLLLLSRSGLLSVIVPPARTKPNNLDAWFSSTSTSTSTSASTSASVSCSILQAVQLAPVPAPNGQPKTTRNANNKHDTVNVTGAVIPVARDVVAVTYGQCVSLWDTVYHVAHHLKHIRPLNNANTHHHNVLSAPSDHPHTFLIASPTQGVQQCQVNCSAFITLAAATRSKVDAPCSSITSLPIDSSSTTSTPTPTCSTVIPHTPHALRNEQMYAHPILSRVLSTYAYAGGEPQTLFAAPIHAAKNAEQRHLRHVLSPSSSKDLRVVAASFSSSQLPSARLAAAFVGRCVFEIVLRDRRAFVAPLVDMVATGVVSADDALAAVHAWRDHECVDAHLDAVFVPSLVDIVLAAGKVVAIKEDQDKDTRRKKKKKEKENGIRKEKEENDNDNEKGELLNVLEALVLRVAGIREEELVRIVQLCTRICAEETEAAEAAGKRKEKEKKGKKQGKKVNTLTPQQQDVPSLKPSTRMRDARTLLSKCIVVGFDNDRMTACLRQLPFDDVLALLLELGHTLQQQQQQQKSPPTPLLLPPSPSSYRGVDNWLDRDVPSVPDVRNSVTKWISTVLDTHYVNIVIDTQGLAVARSLMADVHSAKSQTECVRGLEGIVSHLSQSRPTARNTDSNSGDDNGGVYCVSSVRMPDGAMNPICL